MAIISTHVYVTWRGNSRTHYENLGYRGFENNKKFKVPIKDLHKTSTEKVEVECDYCGKVDKTTYVRYNNLMTTHDNFGKYACHRNQCWKARDKEIKEYQYKMKVSEMDIAKEWSNRNKKGAHEVECGTKDSFYWTCSECNHEWKANPRRRIFQNEGCPRCEERELFKRKQIFSNRTLEERKKIAIRESVNRERKLGKRHVASCLCVECKWSIEIDRELVRVNCERRHKDKEVTIEEINVMDEQSDLENEIRIEYHDGKSIKETAKALGCPLHKVSAVYRRIETENERDKIKIKSW